MFASYLLSEARCLRLRDDLQLCMCTLILLEHYLTNASSSQKLCASPLRLIGDKLASIIQYLDPDTLREIQQQELVQKLAAPVLVVPHA